MSFSPQKIQAELTYQIQKRTLHDSPTKQDLDFYVRKICRLQNDLNQSHDELSKARVRLRRAQDFQIKYDLLLRQNTNLLNDLDKKEKQCHLLRTRTEIMRAQLDERSNVGESWSVEKKGLCEQIQMLRARCEDVEERKKTEDLGVREKVDAKVKGEIEAIKKEFVEKEEELATQIRQLQKTIHEKQTVENVIGNKVQKVRADKDKQISRLNKIIQTRKDQLTKITKQKNQEIDQLRQKFEKMFNFEMENLRKNLDDQDQIFNIEINGLRELLGLKNQEISKLLQQLQKTSEENQNQRLYMQKEITVLKDRIYAIERESQLELYNVKERLTKIHALEIDTLEKKYNDFVNSLKGQKKYLQKLIEQKDKIIESQRKDIERVKDELLDRLRQRDTRITHLQDRIKQSGDVNQTQMKTLHESFHKIQTQKQSMSNQYQSNINFLNQQLSKLATNNQLKNNQIILLHQEIGLIKKHHADVAKESQEIWREEREELEKQRDRERERREKLQEEVRGREREWRARERDLERARELEEREKNKLKFMCQELEKDSQRLNQYIKNIDDSLKKQMKKNQASTMDTGGVRRELTAQLERQKSQLQAIKRMQVDQIRKKLQIDITRLSNENQKLNTDLLKKSIALEEMEGQLKKLEHVNKNIEKINKEKLIQYQKKMATLNNQIMLAQNLYKSFLECKSRQA